MAFKTVVVVAAILVIAVLVQESKARPPCSCGGRGGDYHDSDSSDDIGDDGPCYGKSSRPSWLKIPTDARVINYDNDEECFTQEIRVPEEAPLPVGVVTHTKVKPQCLTYDVEVPVEKPSPVSGFKFPVRYEVPRYVKESRSSLGAIPYDIEVPTETESCIKLRPQDVKIAVPVTPRRQEVRYHEEYQVEKPASCSCNYKLTNLKAQVDRIVLPKEESCLPPNNAPVNIAPVQYVAVPAPKPDCISPISLLRGSSKGYPSYSGFENRYVSSAFSGDLTPSDGCRIVKLSRKTRDVGRVESSYPSGEGSGSDKPEVSVAYQVGVSSVGNTSEGTEGTTADSATQQQVDSPNHGSLGTLQNKRECTETPETDEEKSISSTEETELSENKTEVRDEIHQSGEDNEEVAQDGGDSLSEGPQIEEEATPNEDGDEQSAVNKRMCNSQSMRRCSGRGACSQRSPSDGPTRFRLMTYHDKSSVRTSIEGPCSSGVERRAPDSVCRPPASCSCAERSEDTRPRASSGCDRSANPVVSSSYRQDCGCRQDDCRPLGPATCNKAMSPRDCDMPGRTATCSTPRLSPCAASRGQSGAGSTPCVQPTIRIREDTSPSDSSHMIIAPFIIPESEVRSLLDRSCQTKTSNNGGRPRISPSRSDGYRVANNQQSNDNPRIVNTASSCRSYNSQACNTNRAASECSREGGDQSPASCCGGFDEEPKTTDDNCNRGAGGTRSPSTPCDARCSTESVRTGHHDAARITQSEHAYYTHRFGSDAVLVHNCRSGLSILRREDSMGSNPSYGEEVCREQQSDCGGSAREYSPCQSEDCDLPRDTPCTCCDRLYAPREEIYDAPSSAVSESRPCGVPRDSEVLYEREIPVPLSQCEDVEAGSNFDSPPNSCTCRSGGGDDVRDILRDVSRSTVSMTSPCELPRVSEIEYVREIPTCLSERDEGATSGCAGSQELDTCTCANVRGVPRDDICGSPRSSVSLSCPCGMTKSSEVEYVREVPSSSCSCVDRSSSIWDVQRDASCNIGNGLEAKRGDYCDSPKVPFAKPCLCESSMKSSRIEYPRTTPEERGDCASGLRELPISKPCLSETSIRSSKIEFQREVPEVKAGCDSGFKDQPDVPSATCNACNAQRAEICDSPGDLKSTRVQECGSERVAMSAQTPCSGQDGLDRALPSPSCICPVCGKRLCDCHVDHICSCLQQQRRMRGELESGNPRRVDSCSCRPDPTVVTSSCQQPASSLSRAGPSRDLPCQKPSSSQESVEYCSCQQPVALSRAGTSCSDLPYQKPSTTRESVEYCSCQQPVALTRSESSCDIPCQKQSSTRESVEYCSCQQPVALTRSESSCDLPCQKPSSTRDNVEYCSCQQPVALTRSESSCDLPCQKQSSTRESVEYCSCQQPVALTRSESSCDLPSQKPSSTRDGVGYCNCQ